MKLRSKRTLSILLTLALLASLLPIAAAPAAAISGDGTAQNPYRIGTATEMKAYHDLVNGGRRDACAVLTANVDLGNAPWTPIGTDTAHPFTGTFDGAGYTVSGLKVDLTVDSGYEVYAGLFGILYGGTVRDLQVAGSVSMTTNLDDEDIAAAYAGGVAGVSDFGSTLLRCAFSGTVAATAAHMAGESADAHAGGVVGLIGGESTVEQCRSTGAVTASATSIRPCTSYAGGVVGENWGTVTNCYHSDGAVTGGKSGGIAGANADTVTGCYYLEGTAAGGVQGADTDGAKALTAAEFKAQSCFSGWDFDTVWYMGADGPKLRMMPGAAGSGTADDPFRISSAEALKDFRDLVNDGAYDACAVLTANVDLGNELWTPISTFIKSFKGTFDGAGYTISGLYVDGDLQYAGLFNSIGPRGVVENLTVCGSVSSSFNRNATNGVGGIAGYNEGTVRNCRNACSVTALDDTGGIVGNDDGGAITGCFNAGRVHGGDAGGIAGADDGAAISGCFNAGSVSGKTAGGIVGYAYGGISVIENCRNTGSVVGNGDGTKVGGIAGFVKLWVSVRYCSSTGSVTVSGNPSGPLLGGVVGDNHYQSSVTECYFNQTVTGAGMAVCGDNHSGAGEEEATTSNCAGLTTAQFKEQSNFYAADNDGKNWDFETVWIMGGAAPILRGIPGAAGSGTADDPFRIGSAEALKDFRDLVNAGAYDLCAVMTADIDLGGAAWTPIGDADDRPYSGVFDGAGHTVSGLKVDLTVDSGHQVYAGLFGVLNGGRVQDLHVIGDVSLSVNNDTDIAHGAAGGIAGCSDSYAEILGCSHSGAVTVFAKGDSSVAYAGGIVGRINSSAVVRECAHSGAVTAREEAKYAFYPSNAEAGGIAGICANQSEVADCRSDGDITAHLQGIDSNAVARAGGVVGAIHYQCVLTNCCHSAGTVTTDIWINGRSQTGGVVGDNRTSSVTGCYYLEGAATGGVDGADTDGAKALTAAEFKDKTSFCDWSFGGSDPVWYMGADGPELWAFAQKVSTWDALRSALAAGGGVRLTADVKAPSAGEALTVPDGVTATLDLAGHILDRGLTEAAVGGSVIEIDGGCLTLTDSDPGAGHDEPFTYADPITGSTVQVHGGVLTGGNNNGNGGGVYVDEDATFIMSGGTIAGNAAGKVSGVGYGGGVCVSEDASFTMTGGTIAGNVSPSNSGGGVRVYGGRFTMTGGTIKGNSVTGGGDGGGVYLDAEASFIMSGGTIVGNVSKGNSGSGGGVYVAVGTFQMTGGTISGNVSRRDGGGVHLDGGTNPKFEVSGGATVTDNKKIEETTETVSNIFLPSGYTVTVAGALDEAARLGVSMHSPGVFTSGLSGNGAAANFESDDTAFAVNLTDGGEAKLDARPRAAITKKPDANKRFYDGAAKPLLQSNGTAEGGTLVYALGDSETVAPVNAQWSEDIPQGTDIKRYYVWIKAAGDTEHNDSAPDCVVSMICFPVTFHVEGGKWSDGTTEDKTLSLERYENEDLALVLTAEDVPAVGDKPDPGRIAGSWDVTPMPPNQTISSARTFTYTYTQLPPEGEPEAVFTAAGPDSGALSELTPGAAYALSGAGLGNVGFTADADGAYVISADIAAGALSVVKKGDGTRTRDSAAQTITITKAATPALAAAQPTTVGGTGSIPTTAAHELSTDGVNWTACAGETDGLAPDTYYVRVKAAGTALASAAQELTIRAYVPGQEIMPAAVFTAAGPDSGALSELTPGAAYALSGAGLGNVGFTADADGAYVISADIAAGALSVVKKGDGTRTRDSAAQTITITKAATPALAAAQPTTVGGTGSIPTTAAHELSTDGVNWTACAGETDGLAPDTYYVRVKAAGTALASAAQELTILEFVPDVYAVTVTTDGHGTAAASPASGVSGTEVTLTATADEGWHFKEWQVVSGGVTVADGKFTIGEADVEIKAVFEADEPTPPPPSYDDTPADNPVAIPVAGGAVSVKARVTGDTAALEALTDAQIAAITASGAPLDVLFDLSSLGRGITDVSIPAETFEKSAEALLKHPGADTVTIRTAQGGVTFDEKTLGAIGKQAASGDRVELHLTFSADSAAAETLNAAQRSALAGEQVLALLQLTLKSGGRELTGFGGGRMTVSVPFTPPAGMQGRFCQTWCVSERGDLEHMATRFRENKLRVGMKHLSVYAMLYDPQPFTDVSEGDWFFDAVYHSYANLYFNGTGEGIFSPETGMTRAMFATVLWRMAGEPETERASGFTDVESGSWYDTAVAWASENGIVTGYGDGTFGVNDPVTREQMAAMLYRYLQLQGQGFKGLWAFPLDYPDAADVSDWAYEALCWLTMNGVVNGMDGTLQPKGEASRAQVAALLQRVAALSEA